MAIAFGIARRELVFNSYSSNALFYPVVYVPNVARIVAIASLLISGLKLFMLPIEKYFVAPFEIYFQSANILSTFMWAP